MAIKIVAVLAFCAVASGQVLLRPSAYGRPLAYGAGPYLRGVAAAPYLGGIAPASYLGGITAAPYLGSAAPTPIAVARAPVAVAQPQLLRREDAEYDPNPQYEYNYSVDDAVTGDSKSAQESRNGDNVQGSYSLIEPDGSRRIVEYTADPVNGFNAVVHKEGLGAPAPRTIAPAPIAIARTAPVAIARTAPVIGPAPILAPRTIIGARPILRATAAPIYSNSFSSPYAQYAL